MQRETDKQKCARLAVEACALTRFVFFHHLSKRNIDTIDSRAFGACDKLWQRFKRRLDALDTVVVAPDNSGYKIYVGSCDKDTPLRDLYCLTTDAGHTIYFDIAEFEVKQP